MKLITVHGIMTKGIWARKLEENETLAQAQIDFRHYNYGYFNLIKFCWSSARSKIIDGFLKFYDDNIGIGERPCLIAHSFGTWIVTEAMRTYPSIRFDRVILFGSILNPDTDLDIYFRKDQVKYLLHEVGNKDGVVPFSRLVLGKDAGKSGKTGFSVIPYKYKSRLKQESYPKFKHSSASNFNHHIAENWVSFLLPQPFDTNPNILREDALRWIDYSVPDNVSYPAKKFYCRVDRLGNYYARYVFVVRNEGSKSITRVPVCTSADSADNVEDMQFLAMDGSRARLKHEVVENEFHRWKTEVRIPSLSPGQQAEFRYKFKISRTIRFSGDFDPFRIKKTKEVKVEFNSFYRLIAARFLTSKDGRWTSELDAKESKLRDGTYRYSIDFLNDNEDDVVFFYFEGSHEERIVEKYAFPTQVSHSVASDQYVIRNARESDLGMIQGLELNVEGEDRALGGTLIERFRMFPDGFLVAENKRKLVGYVEAVVWNGRDFSSFDDIKDFPLHHDMDASEVYAIFLAVAEPCRKRGIGTQLLLALESVAIKHGADRLTLVAKSSLEPFYEKRGYRALRRLPHFLKTSKGHSEGVFMEKKLGS